VFTLALKSCKKYMANIKKFENLPQITENEEKKIGLMG
jgi:hypothetical protein